MKAKSIIIPLLTAVSLSACDLVVQGPEKGSLTICFRDPSITKGADIPDTNDFILSIADAGGGLLYKGSYGAGPEKLEVAPGSYAVRVVSREFEEPLFDAPQYGDEQIVLVESGKTTAVHLFCSQMNAGVRLKVGETFAVNYPGGTLYMRSPSGPLVYTYGEMRTGYFKPGPIWLELSCDGETRTLFSRELEAGGILTMKLNSGYSVLEESGVAARYGEGITMELDTARNWTYGEYTDSGSGGTPGSGMSEAYSVGQARAMAAESPGDVWVYGYIVGGDCTSSSCSFSAPFKSATNMVIAAKSSGTDKESCLSVQLQKGDIRDALNLVDNPSNLGRQVFLKGDLVPKYYGIPGIQNLTGYRLE